MKRQIRHGVFETNSSSTHSLTMCLKSEYDKWVNGELFMFDGDYIFEYPKDHRPIHNNFYTKDEVLNYLKYCSDISDEDIHSMCENTSLLHDYGWYSYDNFLYNGMETFTDMYTTPNGETVVSFGYYGYC